MGFKPSAETLTGTLWVGLRGQDTPLCHVTGQGVKCFGKNDGIPLDMVGSVLPDGSGGFWLGGSTALVHWRPGGVSETYPAKGRSRSLARTPDGRLWGGSSGTDPA